MLQPILVWRGGLKKDFVNASEMQKQLGRF
jgi:hypothetical protein